MRNGPVLRTATLLAVAVFNGWGEPLYGAAQGPGRIEIGEGSPPFRVALESRAEITDQHGNVILPPNVVAARSGGEYVVAPTYDEQVVVFDEHGRLIRALGRRGDGPGEFPNAFLSMTVDRDGTVHLLHGARLTGIAPGQTDVNEQVSLEEVPTYLFAWPGGGVGGYPNLGPLSQRGPHAIRYDADGRVRARVALPGAEDVRPPTSIEEIASMNRMIAPSGDSALWVMSTTRYAGDLVTLDGDVLQSFERIAAWFPPDPPRKASPFREPPDPSIATVRQDSAGRLWVTVRVADEDWSPVDLPDLPVIEVLRDLPMEDVFDSIVEVLDLESASVLAHERFDVPLLFLDGGTGIEFWSSRASETGGTVFQVWAAELRAAR